MATEQRSVPDVPEPVASNHGDRPACLMVHGLGGGPYELTPLIDALKAEGLRALAPVLPGHDGPGPLMPASFWPDWAREVESAFDVLAGSGQPVVVVGFSTGATLALHLASRRPVAKLVLLAPFLAIRYTSWVPLRPATILRPLARLIPHLPRRGPAVRDREMRRWASGADRFRTFSLGATLSALELIDLVKPLVPGINIPTLIIQGRRDSVVEPAGASWLYDNLASTDKTLVSLAETDHLVALDREREKVIALTKAFVLGREHRAETVTSRV